MSACACCSTGPRELCCSPLPSRSPAPASPRPPRACARFPRGRSRPGAGRPPSSRGESASTPPPSAPPRPPAHAEPRRPGAWRLPSGAPPRRLPPPTAPCQRRGRGPAASWPAPARPSAAWPRYSGATPRPAWRCRSHSGGGLGRPSPAPAAVRRPLGAASLPVHGMPLRPSAHARRRSTGPRPPREPECASSRHPHAPSPPH
mmetsp:Transcript_56248/g.150567  ORF Transcript_56248/g.150567 Transcript_56248/m.150567 type:complete len:203 (-) Transcript_56248:1608-2216(-)